MSAHSGGLERKAGVTVHCGCCDRDVPVYEWDGIYTSCSDCAFEASVGAFPCDHGAAERENKAAGAK